MRSKTRLITDIFCQDLRILDTNFTEISGPIYCLEMDNPQIKVGQRDSLTEVLFCTPVLHTFIFAHYLFIYFLKNILDQSYKL